MRKSKRDLRHKPDTHTHTNAQRKLKVTFSTFRIENKFYCWAVECWIVFVCLLIRLCDFLESFSFLLALFSVFRRIHDKNVSNLLTQSLINGIYDFGKSKFVPNKL
jgi:hypothetical protein